MLISAILFFVNKMSISPLNFPTGFRRVFISDKEAVQILLAEMAFKIRNRVPNKHRERLVKTFEGEHEDYLLVADTLGVNRSTAKGIIAKYVREGRIRERARGGRNNVKVDEEMKECLGVVINENCMLTLREMNQELRRRLQVKPFVHDRKIGKALDGMLVRAK